MNHDLIFFNYIIVVQVVQASIIANSKGNWGIGEYFILF